MQTYYDVNRINRVLSNFFNATGVRIELFSDSFSPVSCNTHTMCEYCRSIQRSPERKRSCTDFDNALLTRSFHSLRTEQAVCPFGLLNAVSPILYQGTVMGYLFFGQMKSAASDGTLFREEFARLPLFRDEQIHSVSELAQIIIGYILTENLLRPDAGEIVQRTAEYIAAHLDGDLSIRNIEKQVNVSKSVLYSKFHAQFHCTIGQYVNRKRTTRAVELLSNTALSVEEIAQRCGFSSASYFTKTFKEQMGITPLKFRKSVT